MPPTGQASFNENSQLQTLIAVLQNITVGIGNLVKQLNATTALFPLSATTATSATTGANGDVPAQVVGYLETTIGGTVYKVPYYNV